MLELIIHDKSLVCEKASVSFVHGNPVLWLWLLVLLVYRFTIFYLVSCIFWPLFYITSTGEGSSGKSSLINVLMGEDILPTSELSSTTCVCEIRKSKDGKKSAIVYHRSHSDKRRKPPTIVDLEIDGGIQKLGHYVTYVDQDTEKSPYKRVELYWPLPMLEVIIIK